MFELIIQGEMPSAVFKKLIETDPSIGNIRLGEMISDEFIELSSEAEQLIWHWKGPGKSQGLSDENLDALLLDLFRKADYL
ncbi:hypothetical protein [Janthinobacterium lividum]|uniref:hypothetical protein n=1 Tax=Janthinobacterium lividum TaxID=29581 RepID=UPI001B8280C0|nr:hypothetical protein [Janthinobacterium lividum]MBR7632640.1 hypothetical protein [Janthinobacterium lividum]